MSKRTFFVLGNQAIELHPLPESKTLPARVLRYDGVTEDSKAGAARCLDCKTELKPEQIDVGYCDEICARSAMMKRTLA